MVIIEVGAGTAIPTVRYEGQNLSGKFDASLIRINPEQPEISKKVSDKVQHVSLPLGALEALDLIWKHLKNPPPGGNFTDEEQK